MQRLVVWLLAVALLAMVLFVGRNGRRWWVEWQARRDLSAWVAANSAADDTVLGRWPLAKRPFIALPPNNPEAVLHGPAWLNLLQSKQPQLVLSDGSLNWQLITTTNWFQTRYAVAYKRPPYTLWRYQSRPDDAAAQRLMDVSVNNQYRLTGAKIAPLMIQRHDSVYITLDFVATQPLTRTAQTVLQLISPLGGQPYANIDVQLPAGSPLGWWRVGDTLAERYHFTPTADIPMGAYQLNFAARSSATPQRWPLYQGNDTNALDRVTLAYVAVPWAGSMGDDVISLTAQLGEVITLHGYELRGEIRPGEMIEVELFWEGDQPPADYRVYVHLLDEAGNYITGHDSLPQEGNYSTRGWYAGDIVPDVHPLQLPADLPTGRYQLKTGLYHPETGERLTVVQNGEQPADQSVFLQGVIIE